MEEWAPAGTGAHPKGSRQSHNVRAAGPPLFSVGRVVINDFATRALSPPTQCARSRVAPTGVADLGLGRTAPVSTPGPDEQSGADGAGAGTTDLLQVIFGAAVKQGRRPNPPGRRSCVGAGRFDGRKFELNNEGACLPLRGQGQPVGSGGLSPFLGTEREAGAKSWATEGKPPIEQVWFRLAI